MPSLLSSHNPTADSVAVITRSVETSDLTVIGERNSAPVEDLMDANARRKQVIAALKSRLLGFLFRSFLRNLSKHQLSCAQALASVDLHAALP